MLNIGGLKQCIIYSFYSQLMRGAAILEGEHGLLRLPRTCVDERALWLLLSENVTILDLYYVSAAWRLWIPIPWHL